MKVDLIDRDYCPCAIKEPFSVCMTVKNEVTNIDRTLADLVTQSKPPSEIVIVYGGSTDGTWAKLANRASGLPIVRALSVPGASPAAGRNIAASEAKYDLQAMVDADCTVGHKFLANLMGPMVDKGNIPDISTGIYGAIRPTKWAGYFLPNWRSESYLSNGFLPSCRCTAIRRGLIEKAGWFPVKLKQRWGEDTLLMMRVKDLSSRWIVNRNAYVGWNAPTTMEEAKQLAYRYGMGNGEIGCDYYESAYRARLSDPIIAAAYEGYKFGKSLRGIA